MPSSGVLRYLLLSPHGIALSGPRLSLGFRFYCLLQDHVLEPVRQNFQCLQGGIPGYAVIPRGIHSRTQLSVVQSPTDTLEKSSPAVFHVCSLTGQRIAPAHNGALLHVNGPWGWVEHIHPLDAANTRKLNKFQVCYSSQHILECLMLTISDTTFLPSQINLCCQTEISPGANSSSHLLFCFSVPHELHTYWTVTSLRPLTLVRVFASLGVIRRPQSHSINCPPSRACNLSPPQRQMFLPIRIYSGDVKGHCSILFCLFWFIAYPRPISSRCHDL